jgi:hypothetical protein
MGACRAEHALAEEAGDALNWTQLEEAFLSAWGDLPDTRNRDLLPSAALQEVRPTSCLLPHVAFIGGCRYFRGDASAIHPGP